jgi:chromosome segregation ATPase
MGRIGVTYEQVEQAFNCLTAEGKYPSRVLVRERIGGGSDSTIQRHLLTLRKLADQAQSIPALELPPEFVAALVGWMQKISAQAQAKAREAVATLEEDLALLVKTVEKTDELEAESRSQVEQLTRELDQAKAVADVREAEIERWKIEAERERNLAGHATVEAAEATLKLKAQSDLLDEAKAAQAALSCDLDIARRDLANAERDTAVVQTRLDAANGDVEKARDDVNALRADLNAARATQEAMRVDFDKRLDAERVALGKALREGKDASIAKAALMGKLEAAQNLIKRLQSPRMD